MLPTLSEWEGRVDRGNFKGARAHKGGPRVVPQHCPEQTTLCALQEALTGPHCLLHRHVLSLKGDATGDGGVAVLREAWRQEGVGPRSLPTWARVGCMGCARAVQPTTLRKLSNCITLCQGFVQFHA